MATVNDNGTMREISVDTASRLDRWGVIYPCYCETGCCGKDAYHLAPGKTISDLNYHINELLLEDR